MSKLQPLVKRKSHMNMKSLIYYSLFLIGIISFSSCQKTPDYVNEPYKCLCGSVGWDGTTYEVLGAEYVFLTDTLSRKYFVTTEISSADDQEVHHINFELEIEDVMITDYNIADDPLNMSIKEVDYNSALVHREFQAIAGSVTLMPAPFGGPEQVNFSLIVRQVVGGDLFGPEIPYNGNFDLTIEI